jgi:NADPH:quinone reductase-like Zn-dependent oxidoreductase
MSFGGALGCGSHAQYFILPENKATKVIVPMPANLTYDEAAACLEGAFYASWIIRLKQPPDKKHSYMVQQVP